ncbi:hypothetical protein [Pseudonocardia sp.]|uniref:hypothetical protein n=1 Tax=Pseudonocardia sp. TaxID=60912 RepID=UPI002603293A|nr:hypothetical protein [Pseudonocardia sp.]
MDTGQRAASTARALAEQADLRAVVFVEGASDHAALEVLVARSGPAVHGVAVVPMEGFTGIGRFLATFGPAGRGLRLAGLCDEAEAPYMRRHIAAAGVDGSTFHVCHPDLEGELISALGVDGVERVLGTMGELGSFRRFQRQPFHRDRPVAAQLRRFLGTRSGRKIAAARALARALPPPERIPGPLAGVVAAVT